MVPVRIQGREYRALVDSGATRSFISPACVTESGLKTRKKNAFLELGNGSKVLSKFEVMDIPVVMAGRTFKIDCTVSDLLYEVDLILGITWLQETNPLIDWSSGTLYIPDSQSMIRLFGEWLQSKYQTGTVKILYSHEEIESLKNPAVTEKINVIANPRFWQFENCRSSFSFKGDEKWKNRYCTIRVDHPVACNLKVKRMVNHAKLPIRGSVGAAGYDLHAAEKTVIPAHSRGVVKTGISIEIPEGLYARIAPRSGLSVKKSIDVGAGVVDSDYRGEIGVVLINHSNKDFEVNVGDRIAQMILEQIKTPEVVEQADLDQTNRGEKGFGSTGMNEMKKELGQEKSGQNESEKNDNGTVNRNNVNKNVILTVTDRGQGDVAKNAEESDQQSEQSSKFKKIKSEVSGHPRKTKLKTMSRVSRQRQIVSVKTMKKLVKQKQPVFMAMVWAQEDRNEPSAKAAAVSTSQGLTEKKKRLIMKEVGPKKRFLTVEEREKEVLSGVAQEQREKLREIIEEYRDVFPNALPKGRPPKRDIVHEINTEPGAEPVSRPPYRLSPAEQDEMEEQVKDLLAQGFIRPSSSPYGAPILFVPKKDGRWRMCIDYRALNKQTIKDVFPLPRIDSLLERLGQARVFTKLDLASGYHQIEVKEQHIGKTAFRTSRGHYEFLVMPFGLTNAPATFQRLMNRVFAAHIGDFICVYLDDILVFSRSLDEHWMHLRQALERLREAKLFGRLHKCEFLKERVDYLGFEVSPAGIHASPDKVKAVIEWPKPNDIHDLRSFLGLASYYRKFIKGFSEIARPLTLLTRKGAKWEWSESQRKAFNTLKLTLATAPVLKLPDFDRQFVVTTDASDAAVGAILEQDFGKGLQPVAFASRKLNGAEIRYSAYERELLGIVWALGQWKHYFQNDHPVIIQTDHAPLRHLPNQASVNTRIWKWVNIMQGYNLEIRHIPGKRNPADSTFQTGQERRSREKERSGRCKCGISGTDSDP